MEVDNYVNLNIDGGRLIRRNKEDAVFAERMGYLNGLSDFSQGIFSFLYYNKTIQ